MEKSSGEVFFSMQPSAPEVLAILQTGEIAIQGEFLWGSNYTFLADVESSGEKVLAVYKPNRGERPLWDFPAASLARREVAAYLVSEALGWKFVPATAYREDAPLGPGSLQLFIEHNPEYHYFNFQEEDLQRLQPVVLFDLLVNNADRKGSHILRDPQDRLWLIDHGLCFHVEDKLRTVIWDFAGQPFADDLCRDLERFREVLAGDLSQDAVFLVQLRDCLSAQEIDALARRVERLIDARRFPFPDTKRRFYPWPQI